MDLQKSFINKFNNMGYMKPITHIKDLKLSTKYIIIDAKRVTTKFGDTIKIELEENILFLPKYFNALTDEEVKNLCSGEYLLYREGEKNLRLKLFEGSDIFLQNGQYPTFSLDNF